MTEAQLRAIPAFAALPIFDERDGGTQIVTRADKKAGIRGVKECARLEDVIQSLKDSRLIPLGGIRILVDGGPVVVAYFGERDSGK